MKRAISLLMVLVMAVSLCACGKKKNETQSVVNVVATPEPEIFEVEINLGNIYEYFEFKEFPVYYKDDNGNVTSVQIAYGLALKEGYKAANSPEHKDSLELTFSADGVVNKGDFEIDFDTMQYTGTVT